MRRPAPLLVAVAGAIIAAVPTADAKVYPWCMVIQAFDDGWACGFETFEQCRREARPGNTGFCAPNPAYVAPTKPPRAHKRRRPR